MHDPSDSLPGLPVHTATAVCRPRRTGYRIFDAELETCPQSPIGVSREVRQGLLMMCCECWLTRCVGQLATDLAGHWCREKSGALDHLKAAELGAT